MLSAFALAAAPSRVAAQEASDQPAIPATPAATAVFADALARHVAAPSAETRSGLIALARQDFAILKPGEPFPDAYGLYNAKEEALSAAQAAEQAGDPVLATLAYRLAIALAEGNAMFGPPAPWQGRDVYTVEPLIMALVAGGRHDEALAVIRAVLAAPDRAVDDSLFTFLGNAMGERVHKVDPDAAEAFARMGLAAAEGRGAGAAWARERFEEALRIIGNRRILAAIPKELVAPDPARLGTERREAAEGAFAAGLARLAADDLAGGSAELLAAARIYAAAWDAPLDIPETALGQSELGAVLYRLDQDLEKEAQAEPLDIIRRLLFAMRLADWSDQANRGAHLLGEDDGYGIARIGKALIALERYDAFLALARILETAPDPDVSVQMLVMLQREANAARVPGMLQRAERIARVGLELYGPPGNGQDGPDGIFASLLDWTFAQVPPPDYAMLLGQSVPDRLSAADKARADDLFLRGTIARLGGADADARPHFAEAAALYLKAWPVDVPVPEYSLYKGYLANAAARVGRAALGTGQPGKAELALRLEQALRNAKAADPDARFDGSAAARIAMLQYSQGGSDGARALLLALSAARDSEIVDAPASAAALDVYELKEAGLLAEAEALARFAVALYPKAGARRGPGYASLADQFGEVLTLRGRSEEATAWLEAAWQNRDPGKDNAWLAYALVANLARRGRLDEAKTLIARQAGGGAQRGREAFRWLLNAPPRIRGADRKALVALAQQILDASGNRDPDDRADLLGALAYEEVQAGNFGAAERFYREALADRERRFGLDTAGTGLLLENLAVTLLNQGRVEEAEALLRRYMQIAESYPDPDPGSFAQSLSNLVTALLLQDDVAEADELSARALARFGQLAAIEPDALADFEVLRARVLFAMQRAGEAETLLRSAVGRSPTPGNRGMLAISLRLQGKYEDEAPIIQALYDEVLQNVIVGGPYSEARLGFGTALARNLAARGKVAEADAMFERSVGTLADVFGERSTAYADHAEDYVQHLITTGRLDRARDIAGKVLDARVAARGRVDASAGDTTRLDAARREADAAAVLLRILSRGEKRDDAQTLALAFGVLQRAETSAAGLALARSAAGQVAETAGASEAVAAWRSSQARLAAIDERITAAAAIGARGDTARTAATAERAAAEAALKRDEADLAARFPGFFDLVNPQPLALAALQGERGLLRPDEALVILTPGRAGPADAEQVGAVMVVTREGTAWADLPLTRSELTAAIARFHRRLDRSGGTNAPDYDPPETTFSRAESHALYKALFGDPWVAALLSSKAQWTLAPQGVFASLPFAALVTEAPPGGPEGDVDPAMLRKTRWLGLEKALAITPSVSVIAVQRRAAPAPTAGARLPFFGLGDPAFRGIADPPLLAEPAVPSERGAGRRVDARGAEAELLPANAYVRGGLTDLGAVKALKRLPGTANEILALARQFQVGEDAFVLQLEASEAEIRRRNAQGSLRNTDVIALATHGLLAGQLSVSVVEPALALAPPALDVPVSAEDDGLLTAGEAAQLSLSARFVILSACNTAASGKPDSESLSGLARAFLHAGARALLVTHFYVYDSAAPLLIGRTVEAARGRGLPAAEAMRQSMAAMVANETQDAMGLSFAHPKAWAAFAVIDAN